VGHRPASAHDLNDHLGELFVCAHEGLILGQAIA